MSGTPVSISTLLAAGFSIALRQTRTGKIAADLLENGRRHVLSEYGDHYDSALGALERRIEESTDAPPKRVRERMAEFNARKS